MGSGCGTIDSTVHEDPGSNPTFIEQLTYLLAVCWKDVKKKWPGLAHFCYKNKPKFRPKFKSGKSCFWNPEMFTLIFLLSVTEEETFNYRN